MRYLTALPVYNEASHVVGVLEQVKKFAPHILVVNDGSKDHTAAELSKVEGIEVVHHERNLGYGGALRTAFLYAQEHGYDALVTIDCDGQHEPRLIPEIVAALGQQVDIVSGSRYLQIHEGDSVPPRERREINVTITELINETLCFNLTDAFCGFKAYRVACLSHFQITELGYAMPLQVWIQSAAAGLKIVEFPVPLIYLDEKRSFGGSLDDARIRLNHYRDVFEQEMQRQRPFLAVQPSPPCAHKP